MDSLAIALGTADHCACDVDRPADGLLTPRPRTGGSSSFDSSRTGSTVPEDARSAPPDAAPAEIPEKEVILHQLWFQLSDPDRQRFGHYFSAMFLKAVGLRTSIPVEVPR